MSSRKALGRGLGALLPTEDEKSENAGILMAPVDKISPNPLQPRSKFNPEKLQELADSIAEHGLIQPLVVTADDKDGYILIAGERRLRASQLAGLRTIPVVVKEASPQDRLEWALIENIQRDDLNPIEEGTAYQQLANDFGMTQAEVAGRVGKSRSEVANTMRLLKLPADLQAAVIEEELSYGHARVLAGLPTPEAQRSVGNAIIERGLSVRQAEEIARKLKISEAPSPKLRRTLPPEIAALENRLRERFGARVTVHRNKKGAGKIVIHFHNDEDLQSIYDTVIDDLPKT